MEAWVIFLVLRGREFCVLKNYVCIGGTAIAEQQISIVLNIQCVCF